VGVLRLEYFAVVVLVVIKSVDEWHEVGKHTHREDLLPGFGRQPLGRRIRLVLVTKLCQVGRHKLKKKECELKTARQK
jgi:hypothetical protein